MTVRGGRRGPAAGVGAAGARRALCLLALAHSLAVASAQAPKPLWDTGGGQLRGATAKNKPVKPEFWGAKKGKSVFNKPGAKPKPRGDPPKQPPPDRKKPGSWPPKGEAKPWGAAAKKPPGNLGKLAERAKKLPEDLKKKMMEAKTSGKKFKNPQDVADRRRRGTWKPFDWKSGDKSSASIMFVNEAPEAQDVDIFWVKSTKPRWPPLPCKRAEDAVRVRCRFGRRSGKTLQTAEELRSDLQVRGEFNITVRRDWAPIGSKHFLALAKQGFFNGTGIFRAVKGFLAQFGVSHNGTLQQRFGSATIKDDRPRPWLLPLRRGTVAFAGSGANSRTSQLWVAFADGVAGQQTWETPIGYIQARDGLDALDDINTEYGDLAMFNGSAPDPHLMAKEDGLDYLLKGWPNLEYFEGCAVEGKAEEELPGAPEEEEELVGTVAAGKQLTQQTTRGASFIARPKGSSQVLQRTVVKKPREFVQLSSAPVSEL